MINVCKSVKKIGGNIKNFFKAFSNNSSFTSNCSKYTLISKYLSKQYFTLIKLTYLENILLIIMRMISICMLNFNTV